MHADGNGIDSAGATLLSICLAIVELFVFLRVQLQLNNAQSNGPEGCFKTSLVSRLQPVATKVSKGAKIRNRYNQVPHLTQDTNGKVTNSQQTPQKRAMFPNYLLSAFRITSRELKVLSYSLGCLS